MFPLMFCVTMIGLAPAYVRGQCGIIKECVLRFSNLITPSTGQLFCHVMHRVIVWSRVVAVSSPYVKLNTVHNVVAWVAIRNYFQVCLC